MKVVHLSDTHLGYSNYSKVDPETGVNQREADFYRAFEQAVDRIVDMRPDAVIHAGDLFDTVRPQNRAIETALRQLIRLSEADIPTVLISGNHSTPRLRETGNILGIFDHLEGVHPVYEPRPNSIAIGDLTVHAVPHSASPSVSELLAEVEPSPETRFNIVTLHVGIAGSDAYRMDEFNEQMVAPGDIPEGVDYVALGHYHRYSEVADMMYYSGSTERHGFGEIGQDKGFIELDLGSGTVEFHRLDVRGMVDLEPVDATNMSSLEVFDAIRDRVEQGDVRDKIVRLRVTGVRSETGRALDVASARRVGAEALHFDLRIERLGDDRVAADGDTAIGSLRDEYRRYVEGLDMPKKRKHRLLELGDPYFVEEGP